MQVSLTRHRLGQRCMAAGCRNLVLAATQLHELGGLPQDWGCKGKLDIFASVCNRGRSLGEAVAPRVLA